MYKLFHIDIKFHLKFLMSMDTLFIYLGYGPHEMKHIKKNKLKPFEFIF